MAEQSLLEKLDGLQFKFEEISTMITDPAVIADMKRFVKLNKEYHELELLMNARKEYKNLLSNYAEAKKILETENDEEMREMAKLEIDEAEPKIAKMEDEIRLLLIPADPEDGKMPLLKFVAEQVATKRPFLLAICSVCIQNIVNQKVGKCK